MGSWGFCWSQSQLSLLRAGCSLDKSPAHRRALIVGGGHHARCQLHTRSNLGFSILLKDASTCSSAQLSATFQSLADRLYPLSYSCPWILSQHLFLIEKILLSDEEEFTDESKKPPETLTPKSHQSHVRSVSDPPLQWSCWFHCSLCVHFHRLCCSAYLLRCSSSSPDPSTTDAQGFYFVAACRSTAERTGSQNLKENLWPLACFLSLPAAYNMNTTMCKQINWRST